MHMILIGGKNSPYYKILEALNMKIFEPLKKYLNEIRDIESIRAQAYAQGQENASVRFINQQRSMTNKIQELTNQNIAIERRLRESADQRVDTLDRMQREKCNSCRQNLEDERQRLIKRQGLLASKISKFDEVWMKMYQHANNIVDEHDVLLRASGRLVASRNVLLDFKKRIDEVMEDALPLLSIELHDGSETKNLSKSKEFDLVVLPEDDPEEAFIKKIKNKSV